MKLTKRQLKQIIREEHRRLQESGHRPYDPYKAEIYYGGLEELVYKEIGIVDSVRGAANRSPLAGKFYSTMVAIAEAKVELGQMQRALENTSYQITEL